MTNDQIFREMQEADKIRAAMDKKSEENVSKSMQAVQDGPTSGWYGKAMEAVKDFAEWGNEVGEEMKKSPAAQAYGTARTVMADVNRRVFEEPWYGKPVADILMDRQENPIQRDRNVDQDPAKAEPAVEQTTIHGKNEPQQEQDNFWEQYFGQQQAAEQEQAHQQEQGR